MDLHLLYGATVRLYHQSRPYRNYLLCPTQHKDNTLFGFVILTPDGGTDHDLAGMAKYATVEAAIAAAKALVDHTCTQWVLNCIVEEWQEKGLISPREASDAQENLVKWDSACCTKAYGL